MQRTKQLKSKIVNAPTPENEELYALETEFIENQHEAKFEDQSEGLIPNVMQGHCFAETETAANRY